MQELIELVKKYWIGLVLFFITMIIMNIIFGSVCYSTLLFGIPCPFCGMTRATILMLTGHFRESFRMHPLLPLVIFEFAIYPFTRKRIKKYRLFIGINVIICMLVFVSLYLYRMNVYYPNTEPMLYRQDNYLHHIMLLISKSKQN